MKRKWAVAFVGLIIVVAAVGYVLDKRFHLPFLTAVAYELLVLDAWLMMACLSGLFTLGQMQRRVFLLYLCTAACYVGVLPVEGLLGKTAGGVLLAAGLLLHFSIASPMRRKLKTKPSDNNNADM